MESGEMKWSPAVYILHHYAGAIFRQQPNQRHQVAHLCGEVQGCASLTIRPLRVRITLDQLALHSCIFRLERHEKGTFAMRTSIVNIGAMLGEENDNIFKAPLHRHLHERLTVVTDLLDVRPFVDALSHDILPTVLNGCANRSSLAELVRTLLERDGELRDGDFLMSHFRPHGQGRRTSIPQVVDVGARLRKGGTDLDVPLECRIDQGGPVIFCTLHVDVGACLDEGESELGVPAARR
mmetsp:Transcript_33574/g.106799  ORF Transcript_33574/g.106799 Transcript_33574/m.106799 type:complete len:238 (-) Transcript_33574:1382-2095(-)